MSGKSKQILSRQKRLFAAIAVGGLIIIGVVSYLSLDKRDYAPRPHVQPNIDLPSDQIDPQAMWMNRAEGESKRLSQKLDYLEELILDSKRREETTERDNVQLRKEISLLKQEMRAIPAQITHPSVSVGLQPDGGLFLQAMSAETVEEPIPVMVAPLIELAIEQPLRSFSNVKHAVPAGTSVRAILVSSLDAPCGVLSSADPQPVKLRILDDGHLPKGVDVSLKGGVIIGSAYGDISSERVYMRLERLTQVNPDGDFVETEVAGYISGEDGRYGVRGSVVDKSGALVKSAAFSGFASGVSQFLQATINAQNVRDATKGLPNNLQWDLIKEGGLSGCSNALEQLSEYYIHRAEQIQPVIQVAAGRIVDVTFTHGVEIGELHVREKVCEVRERSRRGS